MYNSKLICTYSYYDAYLRSCYHSNEKYDLTDVQDFEDLTEIIYKTELLNAFCVSSKDDELNTIDFSIINNKLMELYSQMKRNEKIFNCIEKTMKKHFCEDLESGFIVLFSYDYFFLTHKCVCDFLNISDVSDSNISNLKHALEKTDK
jgi:hypothetical protein